MTLFSKTLKIHFKMSSAAKRSKGSTLSPDEVLQRIFEEESDNEGMSSGKESELIGNLRVSAKNQGKKLVRVESS